MTLLDCPPLEPPMVELTDERAAHIQQRHPDLLPDYWGQFAETVRDPDVILPDRYHPDKTTLYKWFPHVRGGKYIIVQVVTDFAETDRHWIVTAYLDSVSPS